MPHIISTRIVRETTTLRLNKSDRAAESIGQHVDARIAELVAQGAEVQTIAIEFDESEWHDLLHEGSMSAAYVDRARIAL